jgi:hypothetical protein
MPRVKPKTKRAEQSFEFEQAICVESFSIGWSDPIPKGRVYPKDHWAVKAAPEYWVLAGPRPDAEGVNDGG